MRITNDPAVTLRGVSKKYHLYDSLGDRVREALHPFKKTYHREFWALRDITLDIPRGTTVGILGVNGSGKSTLLQIICSILQPTDGTVIVRGRVAALIELGAGFNPNLTGRENADLNCIIMGLNAEEIAKRIPLIEAFADIAEFFDQPVKTYSSGMFMRVAFATAINVDADILVIDEALAVGDTKFQEKCFRQFRKFQELGKTIIYVTHDRSSVPQLCSLGILIHKGRVVEVGEPKRIVDLYAEILSLGEIQSKKTVISENDAGHGKYPLATSGVQSAMALGSKPRDEAVQAFVSGQSADDRCDQNPSYNKYEHRFGNGRAQIADYLLINENQVNPTAIFCETVLDVYIKVHFKADIDNPLIGVAFINQMGVMVYGTHSGWLGVSMPAAKEGDVQVYRYSVRIDLRSGPWFIELAVAATQADLCDKRSNLAQIIVMAKRHFDGLTSLATRCEFLK